MEDASVSGNQLPTFQANLTTSLTIFGNVRIHALFEHKSGYDVLNLNQEFRDRSSRSSASVVLPEGRYVIRSGNTQSALDVSHDEFGGQMLVVLAPLES